MLNVRKNKIIKFPVINIINRRNINQTILFSLLIVMTGCQMNQRIIEGRQNQTANSSKIIAIKKNTEDLEQFSKYHSRSMTKGEIAKLAKLDENTLKKLEKLETYSPFPEIIANVIVILPTYVPPDFQISSIEIGSGWLFYEILYNNHKNNSCFRIHSYSQGGGAAAQFTTINVIASDIGSITV